MKRPTRSRFMGLVYPISFSPSVGEGELWGMTDHEKQRIEVMDSLPHDKEREIVLHEILHQMAHRTLGLSEKVEERVVSFYGQAIIGHMRDNPELWRYLLDPPPPCPSPNPSSK